MKLKHAHAIIELLSALDDDALLDLGLTVAEVEDLGEVWEEANDAYETGFGRPHPLATPTPEQDAEVEDLVIAKVVH